MAGITGILKAGGRLIFDPVFQETATKTLEQSRKVKGFSNLHKQIGDAFVKANDATKNTPFWKNLGESAKTLPSDISNVCKGSGSFWTKTKGVGSQLWKRMPFIGAGLILAFELPNLFSAFKDKGLIGGLVETCKTSARLVGQMGGFAIGQALIPIPIVGGLIGSFVGDWLVSKVVGQSYSEQKAEAEEQQQAMLQPQQMQQQMTSQPEQMPTNLIAQADATPKINIPPTTMSPQQLMIMRQQLYGGGLTSPMDQDFMSMASGMNRLNLMG